MAVNRILIYRLGSLGDTIVALPAFHLIARAFPYSERCVLTNFPATGKEAPISDLLEGSDLAQGYMLYPLGLRNPQQLKYLHSRIKRWKPDVLVYIAEPRGRIKAYRDAFFFKSCGIKTLIGVPYTKALQENQLLDDKHCYEHEAARLARCLASIGDAELNDPLSWDLHLTRREMERARRALHSFGPDYRFIACSIGTKVDVKNWGQENWREFVGQLYSKHRDYGLVLIGSKEEFNYSEKASRSWFGLKLNLCGMLTPRESAAVLKMAAIFVGHDSGPMHLAASVGTPCAAIFSARNKPGVWFPYGTRHKVVYHQVECYGCGLDLCELAKKKCISSITPEELLDACHQVMSIGNCQLSCSALSSKADHSVWTIRSTG